MTSAHDKRSDLLAIGAFSRVSGLSVKTLRHYGELGLLDPAHVDEETGYRFYSPTQIARAIAIRRLRTLDVPLDDMRGIVASLDPTTVRLGLIVHRAALEQRVAALMGSLHELTQLIDGKEQLVPQEADVLYEMHVKSFDDQPVLSIRERVHADDVKRVIPAAYRELFAYLREIDVLPVEPCTITLCPFADADGMQTIENSVLVDSPKLGRGRIESRVLPACTAISVVHRGPYDELSRAYRALAQWLQEHALETAGDPREIYWTDPEETPDPADYVTEIVWPIVPDRAKLDRIEAGEIFTKPLSRSTPPATARSSLVAPPRA